MRNVTLWKLISILLVLLVLLLTTSSNVNEYTINHSGCTLINPPSNNINWTFKGNQLIWVSFKNNNILNADLKVECNTLAGNNIQMLYLFPLQKSEELRYDIFGYTPINWSFNLSTNASAANIAGYAYWEPFHSNNNQN